MEDQDKFKKLADFLSQLDEAFYSGSNVSADSVLKLTTDYLDFRLDKSTRPFISEDVDHKLRDLTQKSSASSSRTSSTSLQSQCLRSSPSWQLFHTSDQSKSVFGETSKLSQQQFNYKELSLEFRKPISATEAAAALYPNVIRLSAYVERALKAVADGKSVSLELLPQPDLALSLLIPILTEPNCTTIICSTKVSTIHSLERKLTESKVSCEVVGDSNLTGQIQDASVLFLTTERIGYNKRILPKLANYFDTRECRVVSEDGDAAYEWGTSFRPFTFDTEAWKTHFSSKPFTIVHRSPLPSMTAIQNKLYVDVQKSDPTDSTGENEDCLTSLNQIVPSIESVPAPLDFDNVRLTIFNKKGAIGESIAKLLNNLPKKRYEKGIIFTHNAQFTDMVSKELSALKIEHRIYCPKDPSKAKQLEEWMSESSIRIIIGTDYSFSTLLPDMDVTFIIHANPPISIDALIKTTVSHSYTQKEVVIFYAKKDSARAVFFQQTEVSSGLMKRIMKMRLEWMEQFIHNHSKCLKQLLQEYVN